jgi:hypothetical protein
MTGSAALNARLIPEPFGLLLAPCRNRRRPQRRGHRPELQQQPDRCEHNSQDWNQPEDDVSAARNLRRARIDISI